MAHRALTLLENPELTKRMVERARQECLKYSWEAVRDAWMSAYHGLENRSPIRDEEQVAQA